MLEDLLGMDSQNTYGGDRDVTSYSKTISEGKKFTIKQNENKVAPTDDSNSPYFMAQDLEEVKQNEAALKRQQKIEESKETNYEKEAEELDLFDVQLSVEGGEPDLEVGMADILEQEGKELSEKYKSTQNTVDEKVIEAVAKNARIEVESETKPNLDQKQLNQNILQSLKQESEEELKKKYPKPLPSPQKLVVTKTAAPSAPAAPKPVKLSDGDTLNMIDDVFDSLHPSAKLNSKKLQVLKQVKQFNQESAESLMPSSPYGFGLGLGLAATMPTATSTVSLKPAVNLKSSI